MTSHSRDDQRDDAVTVAVRAGADAMDVDAVHTMLAGSYWWSPRLRRDVVERAIANSLVVGAFIESPDGQSQQVGFARGVTDRVTFACFRSVR